MSKPGAESAAKSRLRRKHSFYRRFLVALALSSILIGFSLSLGVLGYHFIANHNWVDSILDAAMILAGMGPLGDLPTDGAKLFAAAYALYSGLTFITATGILLTPIFHRVLHRFHVEELDSH
jgi:hypothetical protein